jgi:hypothetical protein
LPKPRSLRRLPSKRTKKEKKRKKKEKNTKKPNDFGGPWGLGPGTGPKKNDWLI